MHFVSKHRFSNQVAKGSCGFSAQLTEGKTIVTLTCEAEEDCSEEAEKQDSLHGGALRSGRKSVKVKSESEHWIPEV